jgi:hypothetical protein
MKIWPRKVRPEEGEQSSEKDDDLMNRLVGDLRLLYRPKEVPAFITTQFEEAQLRSSITARREQRLVREKRLRLASRIALAGGLAIGVSVAAAVVGMTLPGGGQSRSVAEAVQFLQAIPPAPAVQQGEVIHQRVEQYFRYGPHSEVLGQRSGVPTESRVVESWQEMGPNSEIIRSYARTVDATGLLVQEDILRPGEWSSTDPRTGRVRVDLPFQTLPRGNKVAEGVERELVEGNSRVVRQTDSELVVESKEIPAQVPPRARNQPDTPRVPYFGDLGEPRGFINSLTFRDDGVVTSMEQYVVTGSGDRVLIYSSRTLVYDILDEMPVDIPEQAPKRAPFLRTSAGARGRGRALLRCVPGRHFGADGDCGRAPRGCGRGCAQP